MSFEAAALVLAWIVIALLVLVAAGLMRAVAELRNQGPSVGTGLDVRQLQGFGLPSTGPLAAIRPMGSGVVLFSSPSCPSCHAVLAHLASADLGGSLVVVSTGGCEGVGEVAPYARCVGHGGELMDRLGIPGTPFLLALDASATIVSTLMPQDPAEVAQWLRAVQPAREEGP